MKLVWSPETASKAYIDTVKSCEVFDESSVAELVSAMAAGWNAQLVVETWSRGGAIAASIGLSVAIHHTGGRHICVVPDEDSRSEYVEAMDKSGQSPPEVVVGPPEEAIKGVEEIDFLVVDCRRNDFARILRVAKLGHRGAVLICKNASSRAASDFRWRSVLDGKSRIVRSVFLPVGNGLDIAHVGAAGGGSGSAAGKGQSRWFKHINRQTGEEFVIRR
ncbi:hypothetical protein ABFS82_01G087100 [Erythranthe guttata]|uniref:DUF1442 domain-containing protein n=1 Tax=Erythranthe guttata TaxID=4155 RepID=A0A022QT50_ERYGU|nr:PREDICTED: uncharacterized protein LOC105965675 [Erythranthe guttata]EYU30453.1 hypothetical protein MIMGU_mgv1a013508mg [Erythranthe guttata]|eukprot:XP_012845698.1 PREDICTED: uncharacterized protein LOC105965675 [Erythranthe guttata]